MIKETAVLQKRSVVRVRKDADLRIRIPMREGLRSINVAVAGALGLGEAMRQTNAFASLT